MVTKSKLKMVIVAEKQLDFKKEHQKKMAKKARKKKNERVATDEWEDVDAGKEDDEEVAEIELEEESEDEERATIDIAGIDDSDSDSSSGVDDGNGEQLSDEDEEDIPLSDLEDLADSEKEDLIPHQRLTINNTTALATSLRRIALPLKTLPFSAHQSLTTALPVSIPDVSDDLTRELAFYPQCLSAAKEARALLKAEGAPFSRPADYFAEMVKPDDHMAKIKARLIEQAAGKKAAADARKQRDLKKFGKQVQVAKLQERDKERKQTLEKIKVLKRKRQGADGPTAANEEDMFDVALDDAAKPESRRDRRDPNKRQKKDKQFGFGGRKRFAKSGDAVSSGDLTGFSTRKMKGKPAGARQRPGKARRMGARR